MADNDKRDRQTPDTGPKDDLLGRDPLAEQATEKWDSIWQEPAAGSVAPGGGPLGRDPLGDAPAVASAPPKPPTPPPPTPPTPRPAPAPRPAAAGPAQTPRRVDTRAAAQKVARAKERAAKASPSSPGLEIKSGSTLQMVGFQVAEEHFCVPLEKTQEIIRYQEPSAVPDSPSFVEGIINLRDRVIPIISLRGRFGIPKAEVNRQTRIVILHVAGAGVIGLIVDAVSEVIRLTAENLMDATTFSSRHTEYIHGLCQVGEKLHIILDVDRLLSMAEKQVFVADGLSETEAGY